MEHGAASFDHSMIRAAMGGQLDIVRWMKECGAVYFYEATIAVKGVRMSLMKDHDDRGDQNARLSARIKKCDDIITLLDKYKVMSSNGFKSDIVNTCTNRRITLRHSKII